MRGDVFNKKAEVDAGVGMFYQDDYADEGFGQESSRNTFVIYDQKEFQSIDSASRWSGYLQHLEVLYVNPYTGEIIN